MATATSNGNLTGVKGDTNKYSVSSLQYPIDLDVSEEYGGNKVVFFINVPKNSAVASGAVMSAYGGTTAPMPARATSGADTARPGENVSALANAAAQGAGLNTRIADSYKRLTSVIALYMPNAIQNSYSVNWQEEDLYGGLGAIDAVAGGLMDTNKAQMQKSAQVDKGVMVRGMGAGAAFLAAGALRNGRMSYAQKAMAITPGNSKTEMLFKGVDFRTFQFNFEFSPKSPEEAQNVLNIIRMFRYHMLPEYLDETTYLYVYPSEFDVKYYVGDRENPYVEKQITAVLTNMTVNYTPNSQFVSFTPSKSIGPGMSTQINITLQFKELAVPTKETSPHDALGV